MSITSFIERVCVQPAVYWAKTGNDGFGGTEFANPVQILCRWEEKVRMMEHPKGSEIASKAEILLTAPLEEEGWLYLGTLASLTLDSLGYVAPKTIEGAFPIIATDKTPLLYSTTEFVNKAYLGFKNLRN